MPRSLKPCGVAVRTGVGVALGVNVGVKVGGSVNGVAVGVKVGVCDSMALAVSVMTMLASVGSAIVASCG